MKLQQTIAALAVLTLPAALAQTIDGNATTSSNANVVLTFTSDAPGLNAKDDSGKVIRPIEKTYSNEFDKIGPGGNFIETYEYKSVQNKTRVGNKEILEALVASEVIDTVKGHKIVALTTLGFAISMEFFVQPPSGEPISIDEVLNIEYAGGYVDVWSNKRVTKTRKDESVIHNETASGKMSEVVTVAFNDDYSSSASGLGIVTTNSTVTKMNALGGKPRVYQMKPQNINGIVGTRSTLGLGGNNIVEGHVGFSNHKISDIYFP